MVLLIGFIIVIFGKIKVIKFLMIILRYLMLINVVILSENEKW